MNRFLAFVALVVLGGFLGILAFEVVEPDLMIVIAFTAVLVLIDFYRSLRAKRD
ncbi:MAG: hypothetical protein AAFN59_06790 [Pseudomonadota bacterium]